MKTTLSRLTVWQYFCATAPDEAQALSIMAEADAGVGIDMSNGLHLDLVGGEFILTHLTKKSAEKFQQWAAKGVGRALPPVETPAQELFLRRLIDELTPALQKTLEGCSEYIAQQIIKPVEKQRLQRLSGHVQRLMNTLQDL